MPDQEPGPEPEPKESKLNLSDKIFLVLLAGAIAVVTANTAHIEGYAEGYREGVSSEADRWRMGYVREAVICARARHVDRYGNVTHYLIFSGGEQLPVDDTFRGHGKGEYDMAGWIAENTPFNRVLISYNPDRQIQIVQAVNPPLSPAEYQQRCG